MQGFRTVTRTDVELQVQQTARIDFTLQVGLVTESIEVSGGGSLLATENATVGTVIENRRIVELPLNGRNFLQLVSLSPNVSFGFNSSFRNGAVVRQGGTRAEQNISIAGQRSMFNRFTGQHGGKDMSSKTVLAPSRNRWSKVGRITGKTGKATEDEAVAARPVVAGKRGNARGAKGPCCTGSLYQEGRQG